LAATFCTQAKAGDNLPSGEQWAVVNTSRAFLRGEARYTSECVSQTRMGTLVQVLDTKGYWVKVRTPEPYEGWINEVALAPIKALTASEQKAAGTAGPKLQPLSRAQANEYVKAPKYICLAEGTHIFAEPSENSQRLCDFLMSDIVRQGGKSSGEWLQVQLADSRKGWVKQDEVADFAAWADTVSLSAESLEATARLFLGCPYMWGGMSAGQFDCSGLTGFCYFMNGILLPRDASQQVKCGVEVPLEKMQAGDLVFFGNTSVGHVGLAIDSRHIIHSSQVVRINSLYPRRCGLLRQEYPSHPQIYRPKGPAKHKIQPSVFRTIKNLRIFALLKLIKFNYES